MPTSITLLSISLPITKGPLTLMACALCSAPQPVFSPRNIILCFAFAAFEDPSFLVLPALSLAVSGALGIYMDLAQHWQLVPIAAQQQKQTAERLVWQQVSWQSLGPDLQGPMGGTHVDRVVLSGWLQPYIQLDQSRSPVIWKCRNAKLRLAMVQSQKFVLSFNNGQYGSIVCLFVFICSHPTLPCSAPFWPTPTSHWPTLLLAWPCHRLAALSYSERFNLVYRPIMSYPWPPPPSLPPHLAALSTVHLAPFHLTMPSSALLHSIQLSSALQHSIQLSSALPCSVAHANPTHPATPCSDRPALCPKPLPCPVLQHPTLPCLMLPPYPAPQATAPPLPLPEAAPVALKPCT